jgi:hypothetical protein
MKIFLKMFSSEIVLLSHRAFNIKRLPRWFVKLSQDALLPKPVQHAGLVVRILWREIHTFDKLIICCLSVVLTLAFSALKISNYVNIYALLLTCTNFA